MALGNFTEQAAAYARSRPGYPAQLIDTLVGHAGVRAGDPVTEIGAGTGVFTSLLAERGLTVTAIEPNQAMQSHAPPARGVRWVAGTFEETGLEDASQSWCVAAQAFHWADPPRALAEARRILRHSAALTVLWNVRLNDEEPTLARTLAAIHRRLPEFDDNYREIDWGEVLVSTGDFSDVARGQQRHVVKMSAQRYLDVWRSHHRLTVLAGPERFALILEDLARLLAEDGIDHVDVPYLCTAWTAFRRAGTDW